eukprot:jgi/Mesvir1/19612/Mv09907-RA.1
MLVKLHGDVVWEIEAAWDLVLAMALKLRIGISSDKYQTLRQKLSCMFDQATQSYLPTTTSAGANFPKLPTKHKIAEEIKKMLDDMDIMQSEDGTIVTSSLLACLMQDLRADPSGFSGSEVWMHQSPIKLQELVMSKRCDDDYKILSDVTERLEPTQSAAFARAHYGQFFGRPPIFNIPLTHVTLCMLHMELNMVTTWLQRVVLDHLLTKDEDTLLHVLKDKVRCTVKKEQVKARKKAQGKGDLSERVSIIGREAESVLSSGDFLLDIVFPPGHDMRPVMQGSLDLLRGFWEVVARPFEDDGVEGSPVRQGVADMVKAATIKAADALLVKATAAQNLPLSYLT